MPLTDEERETLKSDVDRFSGMSLGKSTASPEKLKPFSEYLKEAMSPDVWAWYSSFRRKRSGKRSSESSDD